MSHSSEQKNTSVRLSKMSSPVGDSAGNFSVNNDAGENPYSVYGAEEETRASESKTSTFGLPRSLCSCSSQIMKRSYLVVIILCFINLINYMDRFTVAGVLDQVKTFYSLSDTEEGLIQTSFIICYMIMAPIFGYLGDRYNRCIIMAVGVFFWSATTFLGSLIPSNYFGLFIFLRALVGTGEASYSTIAPTIIADLFEGSMRSRMLAVFYFAIPIGSGLGYIVGSNVAAALNNWQWALRVTPGLGVLATILIVFVIKDPPRGSSEGGTQLQNTTVVEDLKYLSGNPSFILSTAGFTCVAFATGALAWWAPTYFHAASEVYGHVESVNLVGLKFGIITCVAGLIGIILGSAGTQYYRKFNDKADPLVCAAGVLISSPLIFLGCVIAHKIPELSWFLIFMGEMFLCVNWPIVADILLYVVIPTRRSIAEAFQILFSHALGDAFSPYITGAISDAIKEDKPDTASIRYYSLQYAMYSTCFVLVIGGALFLWSTHYIVKDRDKCKKLTNLDCEDEASIASEIPINSDANPEESHDERNLIS